MCVEISTNHQYNHPSGCTGAKCGPKKTAYVVHI